MLELFNAYRATAQHLVSILLAVAIWRWGAGPERWLIVVFIATMVAPLYVVHLLDLGNPANGPFAAAYVALDLLAAGMFVAIALHANRNYPLWIAGFQLVAIVAHAVKVLVDSVSPLAYAVLVVGPSYCQLLLIFGGFVRHLDRVRRFGNYREWRLGPPGMAWLRP